MQNFDDTLATNCFNNIRELILNGELLPGEKLKGEFLKQKFNVGLSPVRESLFRLVGTALVEFQDKIGFRVATITSATVRDIVETHARIECLMLQESIKHGDDQWEANIMSALYKLAKVEKSNIKTAYSTWASRNNEFHAALISACKINGLIQIRNNYQEVKEWYTNLANKQDKDFLIGTNHNEHAKIAELSIARKTDLVCNKLYIHSMVVVDSLVQQLKTNNFIVE